MSPLLVVVHGISQLLVHTVHVAAQTFNLPKLVWKPISGNLQG